VIRHWVPRPVEQTKPGTYLDRFGDGATTEFEEDLYVVGGGGVRAVGVAGNAPGIVADPESGGLDLLTIGNLLGARVAIDLVRVVPGHRAPDDRRGGIERHHGGEGLDEMKILFWERPRPVDGERQKDAFARGAPVYLVEGG